MQIFRISDAAQGNFVAAIRDYSVAVAKDPTHFKAFFNRGFSYDKASASRGGFQERV